MTLKRFLPKKDESFFAPDPKPKKKGIKKLAAVPTVPDFSQGSIVKAIRQSSLWNTEINAIEFSPEAFCILINDPQIHRYKDPTSYAEAENSPDFPKGVLLPNVFLLEWSVRSLEPKCNFYNLHYVHSSLQALNPRTNREEIGFSWTAIRIFTNDTQINRMNRYRFKIIKKNGVFNWFEIEDTRLIDFWSGISGAQFSIQGNK